jgi:flagellar biosynthesis GTPase FlhF
MPIQKIIANSSSEGLRRISDEFGTDALILKTVKRAGKVEFFVEAPDQAQEAEAALLAAAMEADDDHGPNQQIREEFREARLKMLSALAEQADQADRNTRGSKALEAPTDQQRPSRARHRIQTELTVSAFLDQLGLTPGVAARLRGYKRIDEVMANLAMQINVAEPIAEGIYAFVGPAGSGKTTSLMKLIVQHLAEFDGDSCAIINTDRYSVGARERIGRFGELVGVDVIQVGPDLSLNEAIARVAKRRLVVIDTPGLSPKSEDLTEQLYQLGSSHYDINRLMVIPANLQYQSMCQARKLYGNKQPVTCIATRMDEALSCGPVLSYLAQSEMPLRYLGTGTKIPEDFIEADATDLVQAAVGLMGDEFAKAGLTDFTKRRTHAKRPEPADGNQIKQDKVLDL